MKQLKPGGDIKKLDIKRVTIAGRCRKIKASYDTWTEWHRDPVGYWLFRIHNNRIEAGFCRKDNRIEIIITGTSGEEIYNTIMREGLVTSLQHAAYSGYELQKAETALKLKMVYVQDAPLRIKNDNHQQNKRNR